MKIIECPRDAMQGLPEFIPTAKKITYLNHLLKVGFDTLDFGSFVSPKAIPQMADTAEVLKGLDLSQSSTKLLAIVANQKGVEQALSYPEISYLGYPFSISETFQLRNTNSTIAQSLDVVAQLINQCKQKHKQAVIYLSMGFGNPYGDPWSIDLVLEYMHALQAQGAEIIALADTTGESNPDNISQVLTAVKPAFPNVEIGLHLHSTPQAARAKLAAALAAGCERFDSAVLGFGGCPMASDSLTGNIDTQTLFDELTLAHKMPNINTTAWFESVNYANQLFHYL